VTAVEISNLVFSQTLKKYLDLQKRCMGEDNHLVEDMGLGLAKDPVEQWGSLRMAKMEWEE